MHKMLHIPIWILPLFIFVGGIHAVQIPGEEEETNLSVDPEAIHIDAFYKGTDVVVRADLPAACDGAVVKIQGTDEEITLNRKGKVYFFWLNVDDVTISGAPVVYILDSTAPLQQISSPEAQKELLLGYEALQGHLNIRGHKTLSGSEFSEFIKLKENNGAYRQSAAGQLLPGDDGTHVSFESVLSIPSVMPSGTYQVLLYWFKDRIQVGESSCRLDVDKVGVPRYLHALAFEHPALYGLFACIVAMATGIVMGLIFGSRSRRK